MLWQSIPHKGESIMTCFFPEVPENFVDKQVVTLIKPVFDVISEIRKVRSELKINPGKKVRVCLDGKKDKQRRVLEENLRFVYELAGVEDIRFISAADEKGFIKTAAGSFDIYIYILEAVDIELEIQRIRDELKKNSILMEKSRMKLDNPGFIRKAPENIIDKEKKKLDQAKEIAGILSEQLDKMVRIRK
jgi:valyl-tRNA synthetase